MSGDDGSGSDPDRCARRSTRGRWKVRTLLDDEMSLPGYRRRDLPPTRRSRCHRTLRRRRRPGGRPSRANGRLPAGTVLPRGGAQPAGACGDDNRQEQHCHCPEVGPDPVPGDLPPTTGRWPVGGRLLRRPSTSLLDSCPTDRVLQVLLYKRSFLLYAELVIDPGKNPPPPEQGHPVQTITDAKALVAMANPFRSRMLDALAVDGPSTASASPCGPVRRWAV